MCRSEAKASKGLVVLGAVSWASWAWASEYEAAVIPQLLGTASAQAFAAPRQKWYMFVKCSTGLYCSGCGGGGFRF